MILDDDVDLGPETTLAAKVDTQEGGMIKIRNEESISAFNIDINSLKTKDWKMDGDESDYFNYGFNEFMWKVLSGLYHFCVGLCSLCEKSTRSSRCQETRGIQLHFGCAGSQRTDFICSVTHQMPYPSRAGGYNPRSMDPTAILYTASMGESMNYDSGSSGPDGGHRSISLFVANRPSLLQTIESTLLSVARSLARSLERPVLPSLPTQSFNGSKRKK